MDQFCFVRLGPRYFRRAGSKPVRVVAVVVVAAAVVAVGRSFGSQSPGSGLSG